MIHMWRCFEVVDDHCLSIVIDDFFKKTRRMTAAPKIYLSNTYTKLDIIPNKT
jgi:hypothetical protein